VAGNAVFQAQLVFELGPVAPLAQAAHGFLYPRKLDFVERHS
jgi:hypothetical protein